VVTRTRGRDVNIQARAFALSDMVRWGYSGLRNIKPNVGEKHAKGIPALNRAARLRADAVAKLHLYCWKGDGPTRERIDTVWQARLFRNGPQPTATNPCQTRFSFWSTVEESLAWRNNAYIWKNVDPATGRVVEWWALHPDQVTPEYTTASDAVQFRVEVSPGYVDPVGRGKGVYHVDPGTVLHIRGYGEGGQLTAPTPIEVYRQALEGPIGRQTHEARMWRRGTAIQSAITLPPSVGKEQAEQWRQVWRANYEGADAETTVVLGGGMEIKPIGMTMQDAQFAEMANLTVQDAARIMGVPADLLGVQTVTARVDLEQDLMEFLRFFLEPELAMIEEALYADPDLFGGSQTYPGFDTSGFVRGDLMTEATIIQAFVQAGILTPNEARHQLGYERDDDPNSDTLQVTPVGGAENPSAALPKPSPPDGEQPESERALARIPEINISAPIDIKPLAIELGDAVRESIDEQARVNASVLRAAVQERTEAEERRREAEVEAESRRRDERAQEAAELRERDERLAETNERIAAALEREQPVQPIIVNVPEQQAPVVTVNMPEQKPSRKKVSVDRKQGFISELTIEEE
jgi:HK97 family phage portal protein